MQVTFRMTLEDFWDRGDTAIITEVSLTRTDATLTVRADKNKRNFHVQVWTVITSF
jgi:hypothetical protein